MELNVAATLKVMPSGVEVDMDAIDAKIRAIVEKYGRVNTLDIKPVAFGLKSIEVTVLLSDSQGGLDEIESEIGDIEDVASVEITDMNRL